jgi:hypothetical protein
MLANIDAMLAFFGANYNDIIVCVVLMVSAIIVAIGLLKPILFNKIPNKYVRKAALASSNVAACFIAALVYFLVNGWNFTHYVPAAGALSVCCIVTYWFYEHTNLRGLISLVGHIALRKLARLACVAITTDDLKAVKAELENTTTELKTKTKVELKKTATKIKEDLDLRGL